ncbi:MAG: BtpA/SgcQ family protein, partial [Bacteroidales bacterium]|nr:BtpA/SgcQ family protein [Bacteroidales bacterium]
MIDFISQLKNQKKVIACIHLLPLPGSPQYKGSMQEIIDLALEEVRIFKKYSVDALIVENFRDIPFYPDQVIPATVAAMSVITHEIIKEFEGPVGVNILRNDAKAAMSVATVTGAQFIRVNVHIGSKITDQGIISGRSFETLRLKKILDSNVLVFADADVKHASPLGEYSLEQEVRDLSERSLADGIIVTGSGTGHKVNLEDLLTIKRNTKLPVILGSGANPDNIADFHPHINGVIVGSYFKKDGIADKSVEAERVMVFMEIFKRLRII